MYFYQLLLLGFKLGSMTLLIALCFVYAGHILFRIFSTNLKRKSLKTGDICNVYIGETKIRGLVLKVNSFVDIWVIDRVIRFPIDEIYA